MAPLLHKAAIKMDHATLSTSSLGVFLILSANT